MSSSASFFCLFCLGKQWFQGVTACRLAFG
jgi:hypothetical protein